MFRFRARNENVWRDAEGTAVELLDPGNVLGGFAIKALVQVAAVMEPFEFGEGLFGVGEEVGTFAVERVAKDNFGGEARCGDAGLSEKIRSLAEGFADGEEAYRGRHRRRIALLY